TTTGLEAHLAAMQKLVMKFKPDAAVVDPVTSVFSAGNQHGTKLMFTRLIDFLKVHHITSLFTNLTSGADTTPHHEGISSLIDTWIELREYAVNGTRGRAARVVKSRGMSHSREPRELLVRRGKIQLGGVLPQL